MKLMIFWEKMNSIKSRGHWDGRWKWQRVNTWILPRDLATTLPPLRSLSKSVFLQACNGPRVPFYRLQENLRSVVNNLESSFRVYTSILQTFSNIILHATIFLGYIILFYIFMVKLTHDHRNEQPWTESKSITLTLSVLFTKLNDNERDACHSNGSMEIDFFV